MAIWDLQASAGAAGSSLLWRGAWNSATSYNPYDAVYSATGSSYISKTNNQSKDPVSNAADWDLLASVGAQGPQGFLGGLPVGAITDYGGAIEPEGWLFCWGQIYPRTGIFAPLFGVLGEQFGRGDGVTTFQLPDYRGRVSAAPDNMGGSFANRMTFTRTCSTSTGSTTLTHNGTYWVDTPGLTGGTELPPGAYIFGPGIPAGTTVVSFPNNTTCIMSNAATATVSGATVRFSMLNDLGLNGSGGDDANLLNSSTFPYHTHGYYWWNHSHQAYDQWSQFISASGIQGGPHYNLQFPAAWRGTTGIQDAGVEGWHDTGAAGGGNAHNNTQPTLLVNKIIKYTPPGTTAVLSPGTGDVTGPSTSTDGELALFNGTSGKFIRRGGMLPGGFRLPRGHIAALKTSNNPVDTVNDIDIQDGECRDSTNTTDIVLPSPMTKRIDLPWAAGTNQGGLDSIGTLANLSYHIFVIKNVNTTQVDCLLSPSATNPALPTGFTHKRRIGSFIRTAGVIEGYLQEGNYFYRAQPVHPIDSLQLAVGTSAVHVIDGIPKGIIGRLMAYVLGGAVTTGNWVSPILMPVSAPMISSVGNPYAPYCQTPGYYGHTAVQVLFDTSAQVRVCMIGSAGNGYYYVTVLGWVDQRGRND